MYFVLLTLHSWFRWIVLASLVISVIRAYSGWLRNKPFTSLDNSVRHWTATIAHVQLLIGFSLYYASPIISYFLSNYAEASHRRELRFFGMEHSVMMLMGVVIITIASARAKRKSVDKEKFKTMAIGFSAALLIILIMIPWLFSPFVSRPLFR